MFSRLPPTPCQRTVLNIPFLFSLLYISLPSQNRHQEGREGRVSDISGGRPPSEPEGRTRAVPGVLGQDPRRTRGSVSGGSPGGRGTPQEEVSDVLHLVVRDILF